MRPTLAAPALFLALFASRPALAQDAPPASPRPPSAAGAPSADEEDSSKRVAASREMPTLSGATGVLRVASGRSAPVGTLRMGLLADWFAGSGFLCNGSTPCRSGQTDKVSHVGTALGVSVTPASFLETYASLRSFTNSNDQGHPVLMQVLGDMTLGVKLFVPSSPHQLFHFGGDLQLLLVNGTGLGLDSSSTSARARLDATADLRELDAKLPLFAHLNVGYKLDNSGGVVADTEKARGRPIDRVERFGLGTNRVDLLELGVAAEGTFPLDGVVKELRPFVEYTMDLPVNRQGYACKPSLSSPGDLCLGNNSGFAVAPSRVSAGLRAYALTSGLALTVAGDLGVSGTSKFVEEVAPQAPWTMWFGIGYVVDASDRPPVTKIQTVERIVEKAPPPSFDVRGTVRGEAGAPVAGALVMFTGRNVPGMITDAQGSFLTTELAPGAYAFTVRADGYDEAQCTATIDAAAAPPPATGDAPPSSRKTTSVECPLTAAPKVGNLSGALSAADGGSLAGASVKIVDAAGAERIVKVDGATFRFEKLPPGRFTVIAMRDGYLGARATVDVKARDTASVSLSMRALPKPPRVTVGKNELVLRASVRFQGRTATLNDDAGPLLEEIADLLLRTPEIRTLEVQSHVDAMAGGEADRQLTEQRAGAVRDRLVALGVPAAKVRAKGFGGGQPMVPNVTAGNRARNQRLVFSIAERQ